MAWKPVVGESVERREDQRFLTGQGQFTDDVPVPDTLFGYVLRSIHAHARLVEVDTRRAKAGDGVVAIYLAEDLEAAGVRPIPSLTQTAPFAFNNRDGSSVPLADQYPLAKGKVRYVGEPIAFVVAHTLNQARDATELIDIDYELLEPVFGYASDEHDQQSAIWDHAPSNNSFDWVSGDPHSVTAAFADAAHVTKLSLTYPRVVVAFMEPRGIVAHHDVRSGRTTIWAGTQSPHRIRDQIADLLGASAAEFRIITPDMGGGFGARGGLYPEYLVVTFAARALGRAIRWTSDRSEGFLTDTQARDVRLVGELALDVRGQFTALRIRGVYRHGAYIPGRSLWALVPHMAMMICGVYRIPAASLELQGRFSNTAPVSPLRGVARAEAAYTLERLVDAAASQTGRDPVALRRLNLIGPEDMPWQTPVGACYDCGDFTNNLELALQDIDAQAFEQRRLCAAQTGKLRGLGISVYVENTMGAPSEFAEVVVEDSVIRAHMGTQNFGMGHETVFAQILADELQVSDQRIQVDCGDTDLVQQGFGSHGSRSTRIGGTALVLAGRALIERARTLASELLEVAEVDLEYSQGSFAIAGTDRSVTLHELASFEQSRNATLSAQAVHEVTGPIFPNGCHACEVEVDPETGCVEIITHVMVADTGRAINPMLVHGQLHGGLAQGLGHVLGEQADYDPQTLQLRNGSFMDYLMPRADDFPSFDTRINDIPTADNPLGAKGAGEGPTTGSPGAMMNAILNALASRGVTELDLPATPERVWQALRGH